MEFKIYSIVFVYTVVGVTALWYYGFSGVHYFVIIAIATISILANRRPAFILIILIAIIYLVVGSIYMLKLHTSAVELNSFSHSILQWVTVILALVAFSVVFVEGFGDLYRNLVRNIVENQRNREKLEQQNKELIRVREELNQKIDESQEINQKLQISEEKYRNLINLSPDIIYWYSTKEGGLLFSGNTKNMLGYKAAELENDPNFWRTLILPEHVSKIDECISGIHENEKCDVEYQIKTKSGNWIWVKDTLSIIGEHPDERIIQGHLSDINERRKAEEQLKDSELRWQFSVDGSNLGLWDWTLTDNQVFFSKKWKEMLGYEENEISNSLDEWERRVHPDDLESVMAIINKYLSGNGQNMYQSEHRLLCKDGSYKWILDRGKIVSFNGDGKPRRMIGTHSDINDVKMTELELKRSNATKDRFFSIIAHDLKNPFNSMIGLSELLNDNYDDLDTESRKKFIGNIREGILKTYDLLEDLLVWSRAQSNKVDFVPVTLELQKILDEVLESLQVIAENKSIEILHDIPKGKRVIADKFMLSFVLRNIISNAVKFTPRNGKVKIDCSSLNGDGKNMVQIAINDTGIGIDEKCKNQLFEIGQNVSSPGTDNEKGTGMGLPISCEFIKKHGGDIRVESQPNEGSTFYITLPEKSDNIS